MTRASPDVAHDAFLAAVNSVHEFNRALETFKTNWLTFVVPFCGPVALAALGFAQWENISISIALFSVVGLVPLWFITYWRPYPFSPENIYDNPVWAAYVASWCGYTTISLDDFDEESDLWKRVLTPYQGDSELTSSAVVSTIAVACIAELVASTIRKSSTHSSTSSSQ